MNPEIYLTKLCNSIGISFKPSMLHWPSGKRASDGIWAKFWYKNAMETTGFTKYKKKDIKLSNQQNVLYEKCISSYKTLNQYKIK